MRYLIIDRDYCVFMANAINGKTQQALKDGKISIIDVKKMEGMALNGLDMEPVQYWSDKMIDAPSESRHVGDSMFETWFSHYNPAGKGDKQRARDAYAAGMDESEPAPMVRLSEEKIVDLVERHRYYAGIALDSEHCKKFVKAVQDAIELDNRKTS